MNIIATTMGIQSQNSLLFKSNGIEFDDIVYLIEQRYAKQRRSTTTTTTTTTTPNPMTACVHLKFTINTSLIGYKFLGNNLHTSDGILLICRALAS